MKKTRKNQNNELKRFMEKIYIIEYPFYKNLYFILDKKN